MKKLFGTDGIRGKANDELSAKLAYLAGLYSAIVLSRDSEKCTLVIGKDTRKSCDMLEAAFSSGALSVGVDVISVGVVPTPAIPHLIKDYKADFGVMISASHNPAEFNGIKLFNKMGFKLNDSVEEEIEKLIKENDYEHLDLDSVDLGTVKHYPEAYKRYEDILLKKTELDLTGLKIALDCANGANYFIAPHLLKSLGAELFLIGTSPDGLNINKDCGSTHLEKLKDLVVKKSLDIGIAFDGDADRMLAVDEKGELIDGDRIMLALAKRFKRQGRLKKNTVVATVMSNMGLQKALKEEGIELVRTKVGDRYVLEEMLNKEFSLGGEQSGHIIIREINSTGDGLSTALKLLEVLKNDVQKASEINQMMSSFPQVLINVPVPNRLKYRVQDLEQIKKAVNETEEKLKDRGRVLLRASGTEPLLRVMVEGENLEEIEECANYLVSVIQKVV